LGGHVFSSLNSAGFNHIRFARAVVSHGGSRVGSGDRQRQRFILRSQFDPEGHGQRANLWTREVARCYPTLNTEWEPNTVDL
jgi:hypothetical protein